MSFRENSRSKSDTKEGSSAPISTEVSNANSAAAMTDPPDVSGPNIGKPLKGDEEDNDDDDDDNRAPNDEAPSAKENSSSVKIFPEPKATHVPYVSCEEGPLAASSVAGASVPKVTIPAVITTTPDNVDSVERFTPVEGGVTDCDSDAPVPIPHARLRSIDDDDDKEKAIGSSPDGRLIKLYYYTFLRQYTSHFLLENNSN